MSMAGHRYLVLFADDATRCSWVYLTMFLDKLASIFGIFHKMASTKFDAKFDYCNQKMEDSLP